MVVGPFRLAMRKAVRSAAGVPALSGAALPAAAEDKTAGAPEADAAEEAGAPLQPAKRPSATASASAAESIFFMFFITPFPLPGLPGHSHAHKFTQRACGLCPILL